MAGTFTHWMVVVKALDKYNALPQKSPYFSTILGLNHFVCLGAVGPDYPYLTELLGNYLKIHSWADRMHYENTAGFVGWGIKNLLGLNGDAFSICLAWLCGFATHLVTDSVIHPMVNATVGPYIFNKIGHRHCELTQDSYIFHEIKGIELNYARYVRLFRMCSDPGDPNKINPYLGTFWTETLKASHPGAAQYFDKVDPDGWHKNFLSRISSAATPVPVFRHFGEEANLAYKRTNEITPDERQRFIDRLKLPGGGVGTFKRTAFDEAVNQVVELWHLLFIDVRDKNTDNWASYLKNRNLDTGADEDSFRSPLGQEPAADMSDEARDRDAAEHMPGASTGQGPSTHIATDIWTSDDTLGYQAYAYAIYRFMTHRQTKPPLTISIQAPWGGGKTLLMRMIQKLLDPEALKKSREESGQRESNLTKKEVPKEIESKAPDNSREESGQRESNLTIKAALKEIDKWTSPGANRDLPSIPKDRSRTLLTVWFNAWKYESTNQVWAGLADAVMKQIAARLSLADKERFWLHLNLRRVDAEKIRRRIYERILNYFWRSGRLWILGSGFLLFGSMSATLTMSQSHPSIATGGLVGTALSLLIGGASSLYKYRAAKQRVENEPAAASLSEYLDIPDYNKELGFVHHAEADLQRVLASVPEQYRPIVIFIDDLDRCSPAKVAQVLEAVNLFLAGDFPHCIFILGMDSEMVAAALQAAHKDVLACLPTDAGIPIGWRFMDKFVQLPFLIPPPEDTEITRYTKSLFAADEDLVLEPVLQQTVLETAKRVPSRSAVADVTAKLEARLNLDEVHRNRVQEQLETQVVRRLLDEGVETFTDKNPEIQRVIATATSYFRGNPRELKRFVNAFRFHYFIWWARRAQELENPTLDQLLRWTVLSLKWPELVRWLRRGGGSDWCVQSAGGEPGSCAPTLTRRLKLLESISGKATDSTAWQEQALQVLRLTPKDAPWLSDADLLQFFYQEHTQYPEGQRLSDGEGKGLW